MTIYINDDARRWLTASTSGKWLQVEAFLYDQGGYCFLGLAEALLNPEPITPEGFVRDPENGLSSELDLTLYTQRRLGLKTRRGHSLSPNGQDVRFQIGKGEYASLAEASDRGRTFAEIAAAVEAQPELFFEAQDAARKKTV